jgi:hypothetical protein
MSLSQIRNYINQRMAVVEPDFQEWQDALNLDNIPRTLLDKTYHIAINTVTSTPQTDMHIEDSGSATITIFKRTFNDEVGARDTVLDTAHCIRMDLIKPLNVNAFSGDIDAVESVTIVNEEIDVSNDNVIKVEMEFNFRLFFCSV